MTKKNTTVDDIGEILQEMQSFNEAQFLRLENKMDEEFKSVRNEMNEGFASIRNEMDDGFSSVRSELKYIYKELEDIKKRLEKRTFEDSSALAKEVVDLRERVQKMEKALQAHGIALPV
jgi:regulator of replication initiation timing